MSYVEIEGGTVLEGEVRLQGSKNAILPILAASILCRGKVIVHNCPDITDVRELLEALSYAGVDSSFRNGTVELDTANAKPCFFGPEYAGKTRGGVLLLGAFFGRFHEAGMAYPGGCAIGRRPIDLHCKVFRELHAEIGEESDAVFLKGTPKGGRVNLSYPSVGATENAVLAAVCAVGRTVLTGAAREPEVTELCYFLKTAGARIDGIGTSRIVIDGVSELHGTEYTVSGDRIAAGTYLTAAAMTDGEIILYGTENVSMKGILEYLSYAGAKVYRESGRIILKSSGVLHAIKTVKTAPYPFFPTDMQSLTAAMLCVADGESRIYETIFESRFGVVPELQKMKADIRTEGRCIRIRGVKRLQGATVTATDLRSGAALVQAGIAADGLTRVYGYEYIARGYEDICGGFGKLGARIRLAEENKE